MLLDNLSLFIFIFGLLVKCNSINQAQPRWRQEFNTKTYIKQQELKQTDFDIFQEWKSDNKRSYHSIIQESEEYLINENDKNHKYKLAINEFSDLNKISNKTSSSSLPSSTRRRLLQIPSSIDNMGIQYWKIKNSWGTSWGENGYALVCRDCNNDINGYGICGINQYISYIDNLSYFTLNVYDLYWNIGKQYSLIFPYGDLTTISELKNEISSIMQFSGDCNNECIANNINNDLSLNDFGIGNNMDISISARIVRNHWIISGNTYSFTTVT